MNNKYHHFMDEGINFNGEFLTSKDEEKFGQVKFDKSLAG